MRITAVIGSLHKGNTYKIVKQLEQHMKTFGDVEFEYIFLTETQLEQCRGCFLCFSRGEDKCPLKDGLGAIEQKLMDSDGAVFASPNYACGATSLMKKFIDRMAYIGHRPKFFGKHMVAVATSAGPVGLKQTLANLSYFAGGGYSIAGKLGITTPPYAVSPQAMKKREKMIAQCAREFYTAIKEHRCKPSLGSVIQFASFRALYRKNPALGEAYFPADMAVWRSKGWLDRKARYYTDVYPGPVKRLIGFLFEKIVGASSKRLLSTDTKIQPDTKIL